MCHLRPSDYLTATGSDAEGLQVLDPDNANGWTPEQVRNYGIPTMGAPMSLLDHEQWATVNLPWEEGALLFTLGTAWQTSDLAQVRSGQDQSRAVQSLTSL